MSPAKKWPVWLLGQDVIEDTISDMGFLPELFSESDFEEIIRNFKQEFIEDNWEWRGSSVQAIDKVRKKRGLHVGIPRIACTDGDCIFQCDEICHKSEVQIDDSHQIVSRRTEGAE